MVVVAIIIGSLKWLKLKQVCVYFVNLPKELSGLRILHISDLHGNSRFLMNVDIWKKIEPLHFDMAVISGDLTVRKYSQLRPHLDGLEKLAERVPVFFADGNHDGAYYDTLTKKLSKYGAKTPEDGTARLYGEKLAVVCYRDLEYLENNGGLDGENPRANYDKKNDAFLIAVYHQPQYLDHLAVKPDMSFCGHTHGGQIRLPFCRTLYAPGQGFMPKYGDGLYDFDGKKMYISRGVGTTVFPVRFFNRPEITVIELRKGTGPQN